MRMAKKLLIWVVVLAIVAVAYFFVTMNNVPEQQEGNSSTSIELFNAAEDDMAEFRLSTNGKEFVFKQNDKSAWDIIKPKITLEYNKKVGLVYEVASIGAISLIEEDAKDLKKYGLVGKNSIYIKMKDGKEHNFEIGDSAPDLSGYYFRDINSKTVYLIRNDKAEVLMTDYSKIMSTYVIQSTREDLKGLTIKQNGKVKYTLKAVNEGRWDISYPLTGIIRATVLENLYTALEEIEVDAYTEFSKADFKKLGLKNPKYEFIADCAGEIIHIMIGNEDENGRYYAVRKTNDTVFVLSKSKLPFLDLPIQDVVEPFTGLENITDIKKLTVKYGKTKDVSDIVSDETGLYENEEFTFNGYDVTTLQNDDAQSMFKNYLATISAITWYEIDLEVKPKLKNVKYEFVFQYDKGGKSVYKFAKKNDNYLYCFKNGKYTGFIVEEERFDEMKKQREILYKEAKRRVE